MKRISENQMTNYTKSMLNVQIISTYCEKHLRMPYLHKTSKKELDEWKDKALKFEKDGEGEKQIIADIDESLNSRISELHDLMTNRIKSDIHDETERVSTEIEVLETEYEDRLIQKKLQRLKHLKEADPKYKDSEIVYIDDVPYFNRATKSKGNTFLNEIEELIDKISVRDILSKFDTKTKQQLIKQANQMKKHGKNVIEFLVEINQNKHKLIYAEPKNIKKEKIVLLNLLFTKLIKKYNLTVIRFYYNIT